MSRQSSRVRPTLLRSGGTEISRTRISRRRPDRKRPPTEMRSSGVTMGDPQASSVLRRIVIPGCPLFAFVVGWSPSIDLVPYALESAMQKSSALVAIMVLAMAGLMVMPAPPAEAARTPYVCTVSGCKYGKALIGYGSGPGGTYTIDVLFARGGTATGWCDPSNNIRQWALDGSQGSGDALSAAVYNRSTGFQYWYRNRVNYRANCSPETHDRRPGEPDPLWVLNVNYTGAENPSALFIYWHRSFTAGHSFRSDVRVHIWS